MAESGEELKRLLSEGERRVNSWLKTQHTKNEDCGFQSRHFMENKWDKYGNSVRFHFLGLQNQCGW